MRKFADIFEVKQNTAERIQLCIQNRVSGRELANLQCESMVDFMTQDLIIRLVASVYAMPKQRIVIHKQYPKDWWEAFKERWFPQFLLKKHPVKYEVIDIDEQKYGPVCPHLVCENKHLQWMSLENEDALRSAR